MTAMEQLMDNAVEKAAFVMPVVHENPDGWGPIYMPERFLNIPYAPFNKSDKLGKSADWSWQQRYREKNRDRLQAEGKDQPASFFEGDEDSFKLVDNKPVHKPKYFGPRRFNRHNNKFEKDVGPDVDNRQRDRRDRRKKADKNRWGKDQRDKRWRDQQQKRPKEASVEVGAEWTVIQTIELSVLLKQRVDLKTVGNAEDLYWAGKVGYYNKPVFDRMTSKSARNLKPSEGVTFHNVTTTDDPVIEEYAKSRKANVFATDAILACLVAAPRSIYSWDIVVTKVGGMIFLDTREDSQFAFLTVNETAQDPPQTEDKEHINSAQSLSAEATMINQSFSQQVRTKDKMYELDNENPFADEGEKVASVAYRYRKWKVAEGIDLLARCKLDAVTGHKDGGVQHMTVNAFNEFDSKVSGVDWRQKLDSQRGAVLATELKNNSNKLARWTTQAILAGVDAMKLGYVSRIHPNARSQHVILGTQTYKPREFARQINLNTQNMWGIIKYFVDLVQSQEDGKFVILKDPNKQLLRFYKVPLNTFEDDEDDDEEEEEEEEDTSAENDATKK